MNNKKIHLILLFFYLISFQKIMAQVSENIVDSLDFNFENNKAIFIKVNISNYPINMFFDTGATVTLIDEHIAKGINLQPNYQEEISGAGGKKMYHMAINQNMKLGNQEIEKINLIFNDLSVFRKTYPIMGGIVGNSILSNYKTEIDFDKQKFYLYDFNTPLNLNDYKVIPFSFDNNIPIPQIDITLEIGGKEYSGKIFFDSGAGLNLLINSPFAEEHNFYTLKQKKLTTYSNNLSKESSAIDVLAEKLTVGDFSFQNLPISISSDVQGVSSFKGYLGILGANIINRFNMVLDYKNKKLYLKPNRLYNSIFEMPLTGFKIIKKDEQIIVDNISKESPFYKKGLRAKDEIISINGITDFKQIQTLLKKDSEFVNILVRRNKNVSFMIQQKLYNLLK